MSSSNQTDVTSLLQAHAEGEAGLPNALLEAVYEELHKLAQAKMRRERPGLTIQPTALVHEAYIKLVDQERVQWKGRTHFYAIAAQAMQRILVDNARRRNREKRGKGWQKVALDDAIIEGADRELDLLALDEAMTKMRRLDERQARVVTLRLFGGLSAEETADHLGVSVRTVNRDWTMGKTWLRRELTTDETD